MADLTLTVAVTTGTQYITGSSGSIYTFDGSQPASFTFDWVSGATLRCDQSDSSNDNHPLVFSTSNSTTLGTMRSGIISSGVTYYLDGASNQSDYTDETNFNAATTRYIEITPSSETDFYFACYAHGIGMGGIMDMTQDTWGALSWSNGNWNAQDDYTLVPSGYSMTGALGTPGVYSEQGWGRATWGNEPWGDSYDPVVAVSGFSITGTLGTLAYSQSIEGWGRDEWGVGNWGQNITTVASITGLEITGLLGREGWGRNTWGSEAWGEQSIVTTEIGTPLTGLSMTGALNTSLTLNYDFIFALTTSLVGTLSRGTISINNGADHTQGLGGQAITGALGSFPAGAPADVVQGLTALTGTMSLGTIATGEVQRVSITGLGGTAYLGSPTVPDFMTVGLSGLQVTGSVGTLSPTNMSIGLTGYLITGSLGSSGVSPLGYKDIDITGYTAYTDINVA
jgi:hypothetical protein